MTSGVNLTQPSNLVLPQTQAIAAQPTSAAQAATLPSLADGFSLGGSQSAQQPITPQAPAEQQAILNQYTPQQQAQLSTIASNVFTSSTQELSAQFGELLATGPAINYGDVNALVQQVLREAYQQNTKDLRLYAEKVKFFNKVKEALRDELSKAREALTAAGPGENETELSQPYRPTHTSSTYTGSMDIAQADGSRDRNIRSADAQFGTIEKRGEWRITSGQRWDPLAIDLNGDGKIETVDHQDGIFDIRTGSQNQQANGSWSNFSGQAADDASISQSSSGLLFSGTQERDVTSQFTQWFGKDEGVVVFDRNQDGTIAGEDLFGDENVTGRSVSTGYEDLALLDSNKDGVVDHNDETDNNNDGIADFKQVQIWQDKNENGIADEGELSSLYQNNISSLSAEATGTRVDGERDTIVEGNMAGAINSEGAKFTKGQLDDYIKKVEDQLNSVGDDAQLANVDLQNMLQKQQQTLQMMSNISKALHDTAMSVIRKMGS